MTKAKPKSVKPKASYAPSEGAKRSGTGFPAAEELQNEQLEAYYRVQGICPDSEWDTFLSTLKEDLPTSARVNLGSRAASNVLEQLERLSQLEPNGEQAVFAPRCLQWYPNRGAWQWDRLSNWQIRGHRKNLTAYLGSLQELGFISRQEAVSMIPPLCLDVRAGQVVLDLCASPGSKSTQIVEMLHLDQKQGSGSQQGSDAQPAGVLVANELVPKRADVLTHNLQRLESPCFVVTQLDALYFPNITDSSGAPLLFDRVLADVPCSGDGTLRKSPDLWRNWTPKEGMWLHHRQYTILNRGLQLLKPGGRLVYSTCSFNPLEDEAVVFQALRRHSGLALAALPELEGLVGQAGLATWRVPHPDDARITFGKQEEIPADMEDIMVPHRVAPLFPPAPNSEDALLWEKHRCNCRRFLPHKSAGGGFFVAVFVKDKVESETNISNAADKEPSRAAGYASVNDAQGGGPQAAGYAADAAGDRDCSEKRPRRPKYKPPKPVGDFERVAPDDPAWMQAATFFGLDPALASNLRRRPDGRNMFWVSEQARRFVDSTSTIFTRVRYAGVRVLTQLGKSRLNDQPMWRATQEGLPLLLRHGLKRQISVSKDFMIRLLSSPEREVDAAALHEAAAAGDVVGLEALRPTEQELQEGHPPGLVSGSLAVMLSLGDSKQGSGLSVSAMLSAQRLQHYVAIAEAARILQTIDLEARTTALLSDPSSQQLPADASDSEHGSQPDIDG